MSYEYDWHLWCPKCNKRTDEFDKEIRKHKEDLFIEYFTYYSFMKKANVKHLWLIEHNIEIDVERFLDEHFDCGVQLKNGSERWYLKLNVSINIKENREWEQYY